jgi:hypothetical protein
MKKYYLLALVVVFTTAFTSGCSKGYESQKAVGDLTVTLSVGSYPLVKGDNTLTVKVADSAGKAVTDAQVNVRFYMPPMPGMSPMELTSQATPKGNAYNASVNPPMEGGWKAEISVARPGKPAVTATFNLDVR